MSHEMAASHGHEHEVDPSLPLEYQAEENRLRIFGFWVFLGAEIVLFACLFGTYLVLHNRAAGGPTSMHLFDYKSFMYETVDLLTSSFTCGLGIHEMRRGNKKGLIAWLLVTALLGIGFVSLEINEFITYATHGAPMQRSAFLSAFFTLVGTHGAHVSLGILWMLSIIIQIAVKGITPITARKAFIVGLYWHFLDVIWVFLFTVVYLTGKVL